MLYASRAITLYRPSLHNCYSLQSLCENIMDIFEIPVYCVSIYVLRVICSVNFTYLLLCDIELYIISLFIVFHFSN
jgi:hypothetical protein